MRQPRLPRDLHEGLPEASRESGRAAAPVGPRDDGGRLVETAPADPDRHLYETDALLPGPGSILAGPTFQDWLDSTS